MLAVTFNAATAYLITYPPDRDGLVQVTATLPGDAEEGLTKREARQALGDSLRLSVRWESLVRGAELNRLRNVLASLSTETILCPLWPAGFEPGEDPRVTSDYYVLIDETAEPEIKSAADMPFSRPAWPLLQGRLEDAPAGRLVRDDAAPVSFQFTENAASTITLPLPPGAVARDDDGNYVFSDDAPSLSNVLLWPFRADWSEPPTAALGAQDVRREQIGLSRTTADQYFSQRAVRPGQISLTLAEAEPWNLFSWFLMCGGVRSPFWLPNGMTEALLTQPAGAGDFALWVDDHTRLGVNTAVLIEDTDNRVPLLITNLGRQLLTDDGNPLQGDDTSAALSGDDPMMFVSPALPRAFGVEGTRLESLMLARFQSADLRLQFIGRDVATAQIRFREVPWEVGAVPSGETLGLTYGGRPLSAYLYQFTIDYGDSSTVYRFTDFERDLSYAGETWTARPIEHDDITENDRIERQTVNVRSRRFDGNPLALLLPFSLEWPLQLEIFEVDIILSAASNARRMFSGEVTEAEFDPPYITGKCESLTALFDRSLPVELIQPACNAIVFSTRCGLSAADWTWSGTVTSYDAASGEVVVGGIARTSGAAVDLAAHRFAGGAVYTGTGTARERRLVADSTVLSGGSLTLTIGTAFTTAPTPGQTVYFQPGCSGRYAEDCVAFFGNADRFRGFPFLPIGNPSAVQIKYDTSAGGKK